MLLFKKYSRFVLVVCFFFFVSVASAKQTVQVGGFASFIYGSTQQGESALDVDQIELSLSVAIAPRISLEGVLAYDNEKEQFTAGSAFVDWVVAGKKQEKFIVRFGKFDLPFGLSTVMYGAPDNALISLPLHNEKTIVGWNNVGISASFVTELLDVTFFVVDGSMERIIVEDNGIASGGRIQLKFGGLISLGASCALNSHEVGADHIFYNADVKIERPEFEILLEIQAHSEERFLRTLDVGYMGQLKINLKSLFMVPFSVIGRVGYYDPHLGESEERIAVGTEYQVHKHFFIRAVFEYSSSEDDVMKVQVVATF